MANDVYLLPRDTNDFTTIGFGALPLVECTFTEAKNGESLLRGTVAMIEDDAVWKHLDYGCYIVAKVPVRESPRIDVSTTVPGKYTATVRIPNSSSRLILRTAPTTSYGESTKNSRIIARYKQGTQVVIQSEGAKWDYVTAPGGRTGYMWHAYLTNRQPLEQATPAEVEDIISPPQEREQIFQISNIQRGLDTILFDAEHIFYRLKHHITTYKHDGATTASAACAGVIGTYVKSDTDPHAFTLVTDSTASEDDLDYTGQPIDKALLDPNNGIAALYDLEIVRDNFEIALLTRAGSNRGGVIEHGVNMISLDVKEDTTQLYTSIMPVGRTKNGDPLYLSGDPVMVSPRVAEHPEEYPDGVGGLLWLDCAGEATVGRDDMTTAQARAKMRELAQAKFDDEHVDEPVRTIKISHIDLGDTEQYPQFHGLDRIYLYDWVNVRYREIGLNIDAEVTRMTYDVLAKRVTALELTDIVRANRVRTIPAWQIPDRGIGAEKLSTQAGRDLALNGNPYVQVVAGQADAAQTLAGNAQTAAEGAVVVAGNAQTAAQNAQTAAGNAQSTAQSAQTAAGNAQTAAQNAQATANGAQAAAGNAQTAAQNAQATADNAEAVAGNAAAVAEAVEGEVDAIQPIIGEVKTWFDFGPAGLRTQRRDEAGTPASIYSTLVSDTGFEVEQQGEAITRMARNALDVERINVRRVTQAGRYLAIQRAPDGGIIITEGD